MANYHYSDGVAGGAADAPIVPQALEVARQAAMAATDGLTQMQAALDHVRRQLAASEGERRELGERIGELTEQLRLAAAERIKDQAALTAADEREMALEGELVRREEDLIRQRAAMLRLQAELDRMRQPWWRRLFG